MLVRNWPVAPVSAIMGDDMFGCLDGEEASGNTVGTICLDLLASVEAVPCS